MKKGLKGAIKKAMEYAEKSKFDYDISFSGRKMAVLFFNQDEPMAFYFADFYIGEVFENNPAYFSDLDEFLESVRIYSLTGKRP